MVATTRNFYRLFILQSKCQTQVKDQEKERLLHLIAHKKLRLFQFCLKLLIQRNTIIFKWPGKIILSPVKNNQIQGHCGSEEIFMYRIFIPPSSYK
jgi:hypothetical protein